MDELRCFCGELILKSYSVNGKTKVRSKVLVFQEGVAKAVCRRCGAEIDVPISLDGDLVKSLKENRATKRLVIRESVNPEIVVRKKVVDKQN